MNKRCSRSTRRRVIAGSIAATVVSLAAACSTQASRPGDTAAPSINAAQAGDAVQSRWFIIGQDLDSIRGYVGSGCCVRPDGVTGYMDLYDLRNPAEVYGGLGIDHQGNPVGLEDDDGGGRMNARRSVTEFGAPALAIGLSITENEHPGALARLVAGDYDAEIRQLGELIRLNGVRTFLRIGYEFDGAWNKGYEQPEQYRQAYRRVVDVLRQHGVRNVEYVWQGSASTVDDVIDGRHDDIRDWYPGSDYVDWIGISWFMHPDETISVPSVHAPPTARQLADELVAFARVAGKSVMIAESAPQGYDLKAGFAANHVAIWDGAPRTDVRQLTADEIWQAWFQPLFDYLASNSDAIRAFAYINCNWDAQAMWGPPYANGFWGDTRLETNPELAARFNRAVLAWKAVP
jgi:hypothetical protein